MAKSFAVTEARYNKMLDDLTGKCVLCGASQEPVECDAEKYTCERCGGAGVYGVDALLENGFLSIRARA